MPEDWYRRKTWTPKDSEAFFARLRRSRTAFHKAQYTRIQAYTLLTNQTPDSYRAALELLEMVLREWLNDAQLASVYHHRAECFAGMGDLPRAVESYRQVFLTQPARKRELTMAHLDFGWLTITTPLPDLYDEAMSVLCEFHSDMFPIDRYRASAIQALILDFKGKTEQARSHASIALEEAEAKHSGFRYHAMLGLVKSPDEKIHQKLQSLANAV